MADKKQSESYSRGFEKFQKAMSGQHKDVAAILNCHLVAEYFLEQIIHAQIPRADVLLTEGRLTFSNKLLLVKSLDVIDDEVIASLKGLNKVRNLCSHELEYTITDANIDLIGRPYGKEYIEVRREHGNDILKYTLMKPIARLEGCLQRITASKNQEK